MKIILKPRVREFADTHPLAKTKLARWKEIVKAGDWKTPEDVKRSFGSADFVKVDSGRTVAVFNLGGNQFRLIVAVHYHQQKVFVLRFYTHREYSKDDWKREL